MGQPRDIWQWCTRLRVTFLGMTHSKRLRGGGTRGEKHGRTCSFQPGGKPPTVRMDLELRLALSIRKQRIIKSKLQRLRDESSYRKLGALGL